MKRNCNIGDTRSVYYLVQKWHPTAREWHNVPDGWSFFFEIAVKILEAIENPQDCRIVEMVEIVRQVGKQ